MPARARKSNRRTAIVTFNVAALRVLGLRTPLSERAWQFFRLWRILGGSERHARRVNHAHPPSRLRRQGQTDDFRVVDSRAAPAARESWPPTRRSPRRLPQALTRPRHGQHRNVLVRKFVTSGTIEE